MELENVKRWQWALIGLAIGAILGASRIFYGFDFDQNNIKPKQFRYALMATKTNLGQSRGGIYETEFYFENLRVHPPRVDDGGVAASFDGIVGDLPGSDSAPRGDDAAVPSSGAGETAPAAAANPADKPKMVNWVTGTVWHHEPIRDPKTHRQIFDAKTKMWQWKWVGTTFSSPVLIPFRPEAQYDFVKNGKPDYQRLQIPRTTGKVEQHTTYPTIVDYLEAVNQKYGAGTIKFRYAWWETPKAVMTIYPAAGLVAIGGIWPTILGLLVGAGFGGQHAKDDYDLSRFRGAAKAKNPKKAVAMTAKDHADLAALEAELEANLKEGAGNRVESEAPVVAEAPVRVLAAEAAEEKKAAEKPKVVKTFGATGGDFYPTEIHTEKK